jgi:hypothetical protein
MPLVGNKAEFAIEYALTDVYPPYGYLRLWVAGLPLGDFSEAMHLYHALTTLKAFTTHNPNTIRTICNSASELPDPECVLRESLLSLGEAHDSYELAIYTITNDRCFRFFWREHERKRSPTQEGSRPNEAVVSWDTYDKVVLSAIEAIETKILNDSGMRLSFD